MSKRKVSVIPSAVLLGDIRTLIEAARQRAASAVNSELTILYWCIGLRIHTQGLEGRRADYGEEVVPTSGEGLGNGIRKQFFGEEPAPYGAVRRHGPGRTNYRITDTIIELDTFHRPDSAEKLSPAGLLRADGQCRTLERADIR